MLVKTPPRILTLDPSFTATGWAVLDLLGGDAVSVVSVGVVRTEKAAVSERLLAGEDDARRGIAIYRQVTSLARTFSPRVVAIEVNGGSQSSVSAKALARAQQACADAVFETTGGYPIYVTPAAVKKAAAGKRNASKADIEAAVSARFGANAEIEAQLKAAKVPRSKWENVFDACAVAIAAWDHPAVSSLRRP